MINSRLLNLDVYFMFYVTMVKGTQRTIDLSLNILSFQRNYVWDWVASWTSCSIYGIWSLKARTTDRNFAFSDLATWQTFSCCLKMNKGSLTLQGKRPIIYVTNDKIWTVKWKFKFWKTLTITTRLRANTLRDTYYHLHQYFPNDQCLIFLRHT